MLPLFIVAEIPSSGEVTITGDEARHAISSLRIKSGEHVSITDGAGRKAEVEVIEVAKKHLIVKIHKLTVTQTPSCRLVVVQALTKGDRAHETIELLTEGGASEIIPWRAARSIGSWRDDGSSLEKWQNWAREATKQSRRSWIPKISNLSTTNEIVERIKGSNLALMFHESGSEPISAALSQNVYEEVLLLIGPEGGISDEEAGTFTQAGARSVLLGEPVLRSAHAGLAALAAVQTGMRIW